MYVLDDKEKKLVDAFTDKRFRWQIWGSIGFIILGVLASSSIVLFAVFKESWQTVLKPSTIEVNGLIVENPFASLTLARAFGLFWIALFGFAHLVYMKKFKRLVNIIDKLSGGNSGDTL